MNSSLSSSSEPNTFPLTASSLSPSLTHTEGAGEGRTCSHNTARQGPWAARFLYRIFRTPVGGDEGVALNQIQLHKAADLQCCCQEYFAGHAWRIVLSHGLSPLWNTWPWSPGPPTHHNDPCVRACVRAGERTCVRCSVISLTHKYIIYMFGNT